MRRCGWRSCGCRPPRSGSRSSSPPATTSSTNCGRWPQLAKAGAAARLVTVIGPGGAGKTRLAVEVAARAAEAPAGIAPDGVWLVELAAVTDPLDVASAVLRAIGTREVGLLEQSTRDAAWRLVEFFSRQRALLILDNCEHLVAAVAELVDRLLGSCPELRILATSRESLAIGGEHLYPIRPLRWPAQEQPADDPAVYSAVRLFVARAAAVRPDLVLQAANAATVVEICRRLDGMPLAIELAAARMRALNVEQIAAKLDDRFGLLSSGSRTALPRHRTLRAVIEWSWALLSAPERELAMRLAVFPAGATLDSIAAADVDVLAGLVDKSLVERTGERYRMLETIRSYAIERLEETGRGPAMRGEHARHFLRLTEAADAELRTADQLAALARLTAEHDNILAALRFAVDTEDIDLGVRLVSAMFWFWGLQGIQTERLQWTRAVLDIPGEAPDSHRAVICVLHGLLQYETGAVEAGERAVAMGIELSKHAGGLAESPGRTLLLVAPTFLRGPAAARAAERISELSGWERGMTLLLSTAYDGADAGVFDRVEQARLEFEKLGERFGLSSTLRILAEHHARRGDLRAAVAALTRAVGPIEELGVAGDGAEVFAELATALEARVRVWCAGFRAMIAVLDGDAMTARRVLDAAVAPGVDGVAMPDLAVVAHMYAAVAVLDGVPERAAYLVGVAAGLIGTEDRRGYDNLVRPAERARELLGARAYAAAYDRGAALTHDAAIEVIRSNPLRA